MKQRLKSLKQSSLYLIAAALVAAIVIGVFVTSYCIKRNENEKKLNDLLETTRIAEEEFTEKYHELSESEKRLKKYNLRKLITEFFTGSSSYSFKSFEEIKEILEEYPDDYVSILGDESIYSVVFGTVQGGLSSFNRFTADCRLGKSGYLVMAQFTTNLDPIYYYIEYDGEKYHLVEDKTLDGYEGENGYTECFARYFKTEDYIQNDGSILEYGFLTDDFGLTYKDVLAFYDDAGKMSAENPSLMGIDSQFWQFYIGVISKDELKDRRLTPDRFSKEFTAQYSGYADMHPFFCDDNPLYDYDNDGVLDRIYREFEILDSSDSERTIVNVYCFLGNGNTITLGRNIKSEYFKTQSVDVTGDDMNDIVFMQYDRTATGTEYSISVFKNINGNFILTRMPDMKYSSVKIGDNGFECTSINKDTEETEKITVYYENNGWKTRNE